MELANWSILGYSLIGYVAKIGLPLIAFRFANILLFGSIKKLFI